MLFLLHDAIFRVFLLKTSPADHADSSDKEILKLEEIYRQDFSKGTFSKYLKGTSFGRWNPVSVGANLLIFPVQGKGFFLVKVSAKNSSEEGISFNFSFAEYRGKFYFPQAFVIEGSGGEPFLSFICRGSSGNSDSEILVFSLRQLPWGKVFNLGGLLKYRANFGEKLLFYSIPALIRDRKEKNIVLVFPESEVALSFNELFVEKSPFVVSSSRGKNTSPPLFWMDRDIFFISKGYLLKAEINSGTSLWSLRLSDGLIFPPSVAASYEYDSAGCSGFVGGEGCLFFHDESGLLGLVSLDGKVRWTLRWLPSATSPVVLENGVIFFGRSYRGYTSILKIENSKNEKKKSFSSGTLPDDIVPFRLPEVLFVGGKKFLFVEGKKGIYAVDADSLKVKRLIRFDGAFAHYAFSVPSAVSFKFVFKSDGEECPPGFSSVDEETFYRSFFSVEFPHGKSPPSAFEEGSTEFFLVDSCGGVALDALLKPLWFYPARSFYPPLYLRKSSVIVYPMKGGFIVFSKNGKKIRYFGKEYFMVPTDLHVMPSFGFAFDSLMGMSGEENFLGYDGKNLTLFSSFGESLWSIEAPDLLLLPFYGKISSKYFLICVFKDRILVYRSNSVSDKPVEVANFPLDEVFDFAFVKKRRDGVVLRLFDGISIYRCFLSADRTSTVAKGGNLSCLLEKELTLDEGSGNGFKPLKGFLRSKDSWWAFYAGGYIFERFPDLRLKRKISPEARAIFFEGRVVEPAGNSFLTLKKSFLKKSPKGFTIRYEVSPSEVELILENSGEKDFKYHFKAEGIRYLLPLD